MEIEPIETQMTVKGLARIGWDALDQVLIVEFVVGRPDSNYLWPVSLTPEAAEQLLHRLRTCLEERGGAAETVQ